MIILKKVTALAVMAGAGVVATSGIASAAVNDDNNTWSDSAHHEVGDNSDSMGGVIPVDGLQNVGVDANVGCAANHTLPDLTVQSLVGLVPIGANVSHLAQNVTLSGLDNGSSTVTTFDEGCTSNPASAQAGDNSHGSTGAGNYSSESGNADGAGSHNDRAGEGGGGLLGATGILGAGGLDDRFAHAG